MICAIYRSTKRDQTYLYIEKKDDFSRIPDELLQSFGEPQVIRQAISEKIAQAPQFLKNAPVVINVSALADENIDFKKLTDLPTKSVGIWSLSQY